MYSPAHVKHHDLHKRFVSILTKTEEADHPPTQSPVPYALHPSILSPTEPPSRLSVLNPLSHGTETKGVPRQPIITSFHSASPSPPDSPETPLSRIWPPFPTAHKNAKTGRTFNCSEEFRFIAQDDADIEINTFFQTFLVILKKTQNIFIHI